MLETLSQEKKMERWVDGRDRSVVRNTACYIGGLEFGSKPSLGGLQLTVTLSREHDALF